MLALCKILWEPGRSDYIQNFSGTFPSFFSGTFLCPVHSFFLIENLLCPVFERTAILINKQHVSSRTTPGKANA